MPRTATVTRIFAEDVETSEAHMISALVESGEFLPARWGVALDDCETYANVWAFCERYQAAENQAPSPNLLISSFPDFPYTKGVGCTFAAQNLARDAEGRRMRWAMTKASTELRTGDVEAARAILAPLLVGRTAGKPGESVWDDPPLEQDSPRWPTPYPTLDRATGGGIGSAELWYIGGLAGHGKTMILCSYVARLIAEGLTVAYLSCEVPTRTVNKRVRRALATTEELKLLDAGEFSGKHFVPDTDKVKQAIALQRERVPGELLVYDPSHGRVNASTVRYHCNNANVVVVDHIGLMHTMDNKRAVDDWRLYATISNSLLEEKLATGTTIMAAAQLNRQAEEGARRGTAPGSDKIGGAYQLVQDADVLITMRRMGKRAMVHAARKVREGTEPTWYSDFDVKAAKFDEISRDKAESLQAEFPFDDD